MELIHSGTGSRARFEDLNGERWWVAKDICVGLALGNVSQALSSIPEGEKGIISTDTPSGRQKMLAVREPGLYRLIIQSRKPEAEAFKTWLVNDVIPSIRRTGSFGGLNRVVESDDLLMQLGQFTQVVGQLSIGIERVVVEQRETRAEVAKLRVTQEEHGGALRRLESASVKRRRKIAEDVKRGSLETIHSYHHDKCPCCCEVLVLDPRGFRIPGAGEYDHMFQAHLSSAEHVWYVCVKCHQELTSGKQTREAVSAMFAYFQARRRKLAEGNKGQLAMYG